MTRNKKKLRRLERLAGAAKTGGRGSAARTLAVTGLLLGGLVGAPAYGAGVPDPVELTAGQTATIEAEIPVSTYTVNGGNLSIEAGAGLVYPNADAPGLFSMQSGSASIAGRVDVGRVEVSGGVIDLAGTGTAWRSAAFLGGYHGLAVSGGTINMGKNSELFIGRNNQNGAIMTLGGGTINMLGTAADINAAHIWAGSPMIGVSPSYDPDGPHYQPNTLLLSGSTINVGDGGGDTRYGIINSQNTVMSAGAVNVANGLLRIQANVIEGTLWENAGNISNSAADGAWIMTGGSLNVVNGTVQSLLKNFTVSGGTLDLVNGYFDNEFTAVTGNATVNLTGKANTWDAASYLAGYGGLAIGGNAVINMNANSELFTGETTIAGVASPFGTLVISDQAVINMNGAAADHTAAHIWAGSDADNSLLVSGGTINVPGHAVISSLDTTMSGGSVVLGQGGHLNLQGKPAAKGGSTILDSTKQGDWVMSGGVFDASKGYVRSTLETFDVAGGTFKADILNISAIDKTGTVFNAAEGGFSVSGGTALVNDLIVDGKSLGVSGGSLTVANTLANSPGDIDVIGGMLNLNGGTVLAADGRSLTAGVHQIDVSGTGVVALAVNNLTLTMDEAQATHDALVGTNGRWSVSGLTVTDIPATPTTTSDGTVVNTLAAADTLVVGAAIASNYAVEVSASNGAASLSGPSMSGTLAVTGSAGSELTITTAGGDATTLIGQGADSPLVVGAGNAKTNLAVADGGILELGNAAVAGGGTLNGDVLLGAGGANDSGALNVVNGVFALGDITVDAANNGIHTIEVTNASLSASNLNLAGNGSATTLLTLGGDSALSTEGLALGAGGEILVGDASGGASLTAKNVSLGGGFLAFDPPFIAAGDMSNVATGALNFASSTIDGTVAVGRNSMVTIGSSDASWLRGQMEGLQSQGRIVWGGSEANAVTAALALRGSQRLDAAAGTLVVDGAYTHGDPGYTPPAADVYFGANSLLVVDAASLGSGAALNAGDPAQTAAVDGSAKLFLADATANGRYDILTGFDTTSTMADGGWQGNNLMASSYMLDLHLVDSLATNGSVSVATSLKSAASVFPGLSSGMGRLVDSLYAQRLNDISSANAGVKFVSRATDRLYMAVSDTARTLESAAQPALAGGAPSVAHDAVAASVGAVAERASLAGQGLSRQAGLASGDASHSFGVWAMPLFRSTEIDGQKAGSFKYGVDSDLWGGAIGADVTNQGTWGRFRLGVALNVGGGDAKSSGQLARTKNDFDFWGATVYAGYRLNNLGLSADLGYTALANDIKQDVTASLDMGSRFTSKVDANIYSLGLKAEYVIPTAFADLTPSLGMRYNAYRQQRYNVNSAFGTVFNLDKADMDTWSFPIGVKVSRDFAASGWTIRPELNLAFIPAAGDTKLNSNASIPGLAVSPASLSGYVFDDWTGEAGLGLRVARDNLSFGLDYDFQGSENRKSHSVFGSLRFEF